MWWKNVRQAQAEGTMANSIVDGSGASGPQHRAASRGASVLLIEDEPELSDEVRLELEAEGYSVRVAYSVDDGLLAARSGWASVLVVDRMLGGGDGLSIIETLRNDGDRTPVLVISALSSVDRESAA